MPKVCVIAGSKSDLDKLFWVFGKDSWQKGKENFLSLLGEFGFPWSVSVLSAHRHSKQVKEYVREQIANGEAIVFITIAGMAAHLSGCVAAESDAQYPVIGVAMPSTDKPGAEDAVSAMTRMPPGTPVMFAGVEATGFKNAVIMAAQIVAFSDTDVFRKLEEYRKKSNPKPEVEFMTSEQIQGAVV